MQKEQWEKVDGNLNINELLKYKDILPCVIREKPTVDGKYLIYDADDGCCGSCGIEYKCEQDGTIIAVRWQPTETRRGDGKCKLTIYKQVKK